MGALDQLRGANGDGLIERARSSPRWAVAIAAAAVLILAWIGWAIYVTSSNGATSGLGVVIAWPAMLVALALISLPFVGTYLLIRRLLDDEASTEATDAEDDLRDDPEDSAEENEDEPEDADDDSSDEDEDEGEEEPDPEEEPDDGESESESDSKAKAKKS